MGDSIKNLQRRQMNDVRDAVRRDRPFDVFESSHVAGDKGQALHLLGREQCAQAMRLAVDVEHKRLVAALDEILDAPRADESLGAGNEISRAA